MRVEKSSEIGFCFGVRRAVDILEKVTRERGGVETLGAVVHNQQVLQRLADIGVRVAKSVDDIRGDTVAISTHGVSPQLEEEIRARHIDIINATCPFVHRAQLAARKLAESGFFVIIYGDADHSEVKGILGWANGKGIATLDEKFITKFDRLPRRLGVLSQTTQIPAHFTEFVKKLIDSALAKGFKCRYYKGEFPLKTMLADDLEQGIILTLLSLNRIYTLPLYFMPVDIKWSPNNRKGAVAYHRSPVQLRGYQVHHYTCISGFAFN